MDEKEDGMELMRVLLAVLELDLTGASSCLETGVDL